MAKHAEQEHARPKQGHHHHDHDHCHGHVRNESRAFWAAVITGVFMVVEAVGGVLSGSLALLADAGHMLADSGSLFLAWFGFRLARLPVDEHRTFGYHRFQVLAAFVNGLTLFVVAGWIVFEAFERVLSPVPVQADTMIVIAALGFAVNLVAFAILHGADQDNLNIQGAVIHVLGDLLGSVAAIVGAAVILWTGWLPIDPLLSVLVALLILRSAWSVTARSGHILLEGAPPRIDVSRIPTSLTQALPGVVAVEHVHVWCLTQERVLATLHAHTCGTADPCAERAAIREHLRESFGIDHVTIEIAPADAGEKPLQDPAV
ncbi:MAG: cation diffusion facilitator family transporter [Alphaproteobacteria bacterium]